MLRPPRVTAGGGRLTVRGPVRVRRVRIDDTATRGILGASGLE